MIEHVCLLSTLKNESYITPELIFTCEKEVIAYKTEYRHAKTLAKVSSSTKIKDMLLHLDKLIEDTYVVGEKKFRLGDLHDKNILFNNFYYMIDLDFGKEENIEEINKYNVQNLITLLFDFFFAIEDYEIADFWNPCLSELYHATIYKDYKNIYSFFEAFSELEKKKDLEIKDLRHSRLLTKKYNSYYKPDFL